MEEKTVCVRVISVANQKVLWSCKKYNDFKS